MGVRQHNVHFPDLDSRSGTCVPSGSLHRQVRRPSIYTRVAAVNAAATGSRSSPRIRILHIENKPKLYKKTCQVSISSRKQGIVICCKTSSKPLLNATAIGLGARLAQPKKTYLTAGNDRVCIRACMSRHRDAGRLCAASDDPVII